jgi:UPF0271 protein
VKSIDLNCDLGEGAGHDAALMPLITSANIACGGHAGDAATMRATVELAAVHHVAIGAHPGFEDREHFGRRELTLPAEEIFALVARQIRALAVIVRVNGRRLAHVKPHGGLYNLAARDRAVADPVARAVHAVNPQAILVGLAGSALLDAGRALGLRVAAEGFADRRYAPDGRLVPRTEAGAVLHDPAAVGAQAVQLARDGRVRAADGSELAVAADTLCLHGDGRDAVTLARRVRAELGAARVGLKAL